jgi:Flp pilus assembly protein TadD
MQATGKNVEIRDGGEAVRLAEIACRLSQNKEPTILDTLAAAYAEAGRFEEALQTATKALSLARQLKQEDLAREIEARIELFKTGKPFRE